jgi:hypothetical protein
MIGRAGNIRRTLGDAAGQLAAAWGQRFKRVDAEGSED